jgi:peptide/nickel transport system substrate-binding protein
VAPLVAVCVLAGACAVACSGGGSGGTGGDGATPRKIALIDINAKPADQVKDGGTLRYAIDQWVPQWNQLQVDGALQVADEPESAIFPRMFRSDDKGDVEPNPDFLSDASVVQKKPKQAVTYTINPKAKWSNGDPITWKDFAAQWKAMRGTDSRYQVASTTGYERIDAVKKGSDDRTVHVTFDKPFGEWLKLFDPLYPAKYTSDPDKFNNAYREKIPETAGPFKVSKIDKTSQSVTLVRDPKWWGTRPKLDSIVFRSMDDSAMPGAFANGEIDYAPIGADASAYKQATGVKGAQVRKAAGPDYRTLTFGRSGAFTDVKVRQAVAMGINRQAIATADLQGLDWPIRTMDNHFFVNTQAGYRDNAGMTGTFNQNRAKQTLDGLGWKPGTGGVRTKGGKQLTVDMVIPSGTPASKNEAEIVQTMLKDIGVKLDIRSVSSNDFFNKYVMPGDFDLAPFSWIGTPFPIADAKSIYGTPKGDDPQQNFGRIGSEKADKLMDKAQSELNVQQARADMNEADNLIWSIAHSLILYQRPQYTAVKANLANIGSWGFQSRNFATVGFTK